MRILIAVLMVGLMAGAAYPYDRTLIPEGAELRVRVDVDPDGNRAIRIDRYHGSAAGLEHKHGPLWINACALNGVSADFCF